MRSLVWLSLFLSGYGHADLVSLDDAAMQNVYAQSAIGIGIEKSIDVGALTYTDDGTSVEIQNIEIGAPSDVANTPTFSNHIIHVDGDKGLFIESMFDPTRIQVGGISVGDHIGSRSFGQFILDFEGSNILNINSNGGGGFLISSTSQFENVNFVWSTNGQSLRFDTMTIDSQLTNALFQEQDISATHKALVIEIPSYSHQMTLAGVCFSDAPCTADNSFGAISVSQALTNSQIQIHGGGRSGQGLTINLYFEFDETDNATGDGNVFTYTDETSFKIAKQSGNVTISGLTFDVGTADAILGDHIVLQYDSAVGNFKSDLVEIAGNTVGGFDFQFDFSDGTHDSIDYVNQVKIAPGIAFAGQDFSSDASLLAAGFDTFMTHFYSKVANTSDGLSVFNQWNMTGDFYYTEDTHTIMADNLYAYGEGYTTLDIRSGADSIDNTNDPAENFLAIGIRDYKVNYGLDGLRVGDDTSQLQNGYEFLGLAADASFTLNGGLEIRGGGAAGSGLTLDADMLISDGNFTLTKSGSVGIHLDAVKYEFHLRDATLDVNSSGIQLVLGELWSEFITEDVRFGDRTAGNSLGSVAMTQYEKGSTISINGGGAAVTQCIGASGADETTCDTNGGYWLNTGSEGLTISSQRLLLQENVVEGKSNSVTIEMNRTGGAGTGQSLKLNNIYTSDGYDDTTNTYGVQHTLSVDVARSRVIKKDTGTDSNGITGNEGDEVITSGTGATEYTYVANPDATERANRPETLVLSNHIQIKELNVDSVELIHGGSSTGQTMLQGMKLQNLDLTSRLMVAPIR